MPKGITDESKWEKAKKSAEKQGRKNDYAYIMGIYKKMGGGFKKAEDHLRDLLKARPTKYIRRVAKPGGGYKYYYTQETRKEQAREIELASVREKEKEAKKTIMTFGKFRGKTVADVLKEEPRYLLWAARNTDRPEAELGAYIYINGANMNTKMTFGIYEGKSVREIVKIDHGYLEFLSSEGFADNHVAVAVYEKMKDYVKKNPDKITKNSSLYPLAQKMKKISIFEKQREEYERRLNIV